MPWHFVAKAPRDAVLQRIPVSVHGSVPGLEAAELQTFKDLCWKGMCVPAGPAAGLREPGEMYIVFPLINMNAAPLQKCTGLINEILIFLECGACLISLH